MKKYRKSFNIQKIKKNISYSIQDIAECLGVHKRTVQAWHKEGLKTIDNNIPFLFHGSVLRDFLKCRQQKRQYRCKAEEFFCMKCQLPRKAWEGMIDIHIINQKCMNLKGVCEVCNTTVNKLAGVKKLSEMHRLFHIQQIHQKHIIELPNNSSSTDINNGGNNDKN